MRPVTCSTSAAKCSTALTCAPGRCRRRCDWSERENTYLLLARVALGLLSDTHKVPSRQYLTVRNALHETIEVRALW